MIDAYHGEGVDEDGWGHNATYEDLEEIIKNGAGWKELIFRSASNRWFEPVVFQTAADGTVTTEETTRRSAQPGAWDTMIKERDGEQSGARVEMWTSEEGGDDESPSVEVRVRRGKGAEYVQGGRSVDEHLVSYARCLRSWAGRDKRGICLTLRWRMSRVLSLESDRCSVWSGV